MISYALLERNRKPGFTLLEVVLAIAIATGILVVVLFFYQQAANLRTQLLQEAERVSTIRLLMDRITADLRSARSDFNAGEGLSGDTVSLRFVKTEVLSRSAWTGGPFGRAVAAETDLRRVSYGITSSTEGTNVVVTGLVRTEQPLVTQRQLADPKRPSALPVESTTRVKNAPEPLTDVIRFVAFRYWDGSSWRESWNATELPQGVEVSLGSDPLPAETEPEDYPSELYRRVIYLPGSGVNNGGLTPPDLMEEAIPPTEEKP